jgi:murein endopeptidase
MKKYAKVFRKWAIKEKLANAEARLVTWLNAVWEFRDHSVRLHILLSLQLASLRLLHQVLIQPTTPDVTKHQFVSTS